MEFLDTLGGRWNISLFHYRNHGADFGRVLAGFEVPDEDARAFEAFLTSSAIATSASTTMRPTRCFWVSRAWNPEWTLADSRAAVALEQLVDGDRHLRAALKDCRNLALLEPLPERGR